jgi:TolB-like protein/Tfp pilus assembly protein PilF
MSDSVSFFQELKRRNVFRVVIGYVVLAWLVMQVADVVLNNIEAPDWVFQAMMFFLGLGLLFAVFFSWAFEMTPEGLKRESEVDRSQSITAVTGKKLDRMVTGILVIALGYFVLDKFVLSAGREEAAVEAALQQASTPAESGPAAAPGDDPPSGAVPDNTIAVLPFVNMSSDPEQEYFSDGLSEELLNLLAKIPELQVASRSSAFQFKGEKIDLPVVAKQLNVAHVLEGSVRKAGNQLRITAQLIRADNGYHMWSETYDRSLDNIFAIQDEISAAVVDALKIELLGEAPKSQVVNPEAYALVLKGRFLHSKWGKDNFEKAVEAYEQALKLDPDYAEAWASLSVTYLNQMQSGYRDPDEGLALSKAAVERALAINPQLPGAWARLSLIQNIFEWDWAGAQSSINKAMALDPDSLYVLGAAASLASALGKPGKAMVYYDRALTVDPLNLVQLYNRADTLNQLGQVEQAKAGFRRLLELNPQDWGSHTQLAILEMRSGNIEQAWLELEKEVDPQQQEFGRILALFTEGKTNEANQRVQAFSDEHSSWGSSTIALMHAYADQTDQAFEWLNRAVENRDSNLSAIIRDPIMAPLLDDPRMDEVLAKMGLAEDH